MSPSKTINSTGEKISRASRGSRFFLWNKPTYFLDLFSGSGAIGIEALSRGAKQCYFVENNINANQLYYFSLLHHEFPLDNHFSVSLTLRY